MNKNKEFQLERFNDIQKMAKDAELKKKSLDWMILADKYKYTYNYSWMGRPIIKFPNDMIMQQEIMWDIRPDLIIETGIAHGGSIIFSAGMQEMMNIENGHVIGIDIDIREHNKKEIENHPMSKRMTMFEGSCLDPKIIDNVSKIASEHKTIMVVLDSLHTHDHVLKELNIYSKFVSLDSYLILPDTFIEQFPKGYFSDRAWDVGNNPMSALKDFMSSNNQFEIDRDRCDKLLISEAPDGYLKRVR